MENTSRPDLGPAVKRLITIDLAAIVAMLVVSAWGWIQIPEGARIAVHWGAYGQADQFMGKVPGLLWIPGLALFVSLLMLAFLLVPRFEFVRSMKAYVAVATSVLALLLGFHAVAVLSAAGHQFNAPAIVLTLVGAMLIAIGNYFPKMRRNRWMGVRTPWTRASDYCWDKTHRLAGRLFIGYGLLLVLIAWSGMSPVWQGGIALTGVFGVILVVYVYSYLVWAKNPGK